MRRRGLIAMVLLSAGIAAAESVPPLADANCDALSSAADLTAAATVAQDDFAFKDCRAADQFRNHHFTAESERQLLDDLYHRRETPWTPTPTVTRRATSTATATPTVTPTATTSGTPTTSATPSHSTTATASPTNTPRPTATRTNTPSRTMTLTRTPSPTPTPTGLAQQLAGTWTADWQNGLLACCFLIGQPQPLCVQDTTYEVTAAPNNQLTITDLGTGMVLGTASVSPNGTVQPPAVTEPGGTCDVDGQPIVFQFTYVFTFNPNGTGAAEVDWQRLTHCQTCDQHDTAALHRTARP